MPGKNQTLALLLLYPVFQPHSLRSTLAVKTVAGVNLPQVGVGMEMAEPAISAELA